MNIAVSEHALAGPRMSDRCLGITSWRSDTPRQQARVETVLHDQGDSRVQTEGQEGHGEGTSMLDETSDTYRAPAPRLLRRYQHMAAAMKKSMAVEVPNAAVMAH